MRAKAKIVGIGSRRSGISTKNNKAYDFTPISFVYEETGVNGFAANTANVDQSVLSAVPGLNVNAEVDIIYSSYPRFTVHGIV